MSKHTPGPWSVNEGMYCGARIDGPNGRGVAHSTQRDPHPTLGQGITQDEAKANARLIAASPRLLAAAKGVLETLWRLHGNGYGTKYEEAVASLQEAVDEATGEQA